MVSRVLFVLFTFYVCAVSSSRTLAPSPDNSQIRVQLSKYMSHMTHVYLVSVDYALYHSDCKKYEQLLGKVVHGRSPENSLVYCYKQVMSGFAAALTRKEAEKLKGEEGVQSVIKDTDYGLGDDDVDIKDNNN